MRLEDNPGLRAYARLSRSLIRLMLVLSGASLICMMVLVTADVILRGFGAPIKGSVDLVSLLGAVAIAGALPYTTAVKGHVAIEFFFQMLPRRGRVVVDTLSRMIVLFLFAALSFYFIKYGQDLRGSSQVTPTLQIPVFWVPWLFSVSCAAVVLVKVYHLFNPGRTMIKP